MSESKEYDREGAFIRRGPKGENWNNEMRRDGWPVVDKDGWPFVIVRRKKNFRKIR